MWRLYEYSIHHRNPAVQRLSIHLEKMQNITFQSTECLKNILKHPGNHKTNRMDGNK